MTRSSNPNILFIMCDQLRWDYLSCYGHPNLKTPNMDFLASNGVRFNQAYCQAPLCGPSRASFYTGRYMSSHGAMTNDDPLKVGEITMGDYLEELGYRVALVGKTHTTVSAAGRSRLGLDENTGLAKRLACGGFEPYEIHEGLYPDPIVPDNLSFNQYLKSAGFSEPNGWQAYANSTIDKAGNNLDGWLLRNSAYPSPLPEQFTETAFVTDRAMEFIDEAHDKEPWCLHLSYIKPHWPTVASDPYHQIYNAEDVIAPVRSDQEKLNRHPVVDAFAQQEYSLNYAKDAVRDTVIPVYMGLIKQIDDHLGRIFKHLKALSCWENTIIVLTSDHGDYLGDHWLGEKDLFHDCSVKIPLIIHDPRVGSDASRGKVVDAMVESIDLIPTFIECAGGEPCLERLEGNSLTPYLQNQADNQDSQSIGPREFVISEIDYSDRGPRTMLNIPPYLCRAYMLRTPQWKYILYEGFRSQLFNLENDPDELTDLGESVRHKDIIQEMDAKLFSWLRQRKQRTELPYQNLDRMGPEYDESLGIIIGRW